jgi:4-aminobutyrate aminotransferase-like enzyme
MNAGTLPFVGKHKEYRVQLAPPGCPDIIGWQKGTGRVIGVECKVSSNKRTPRQEEFAKMMVADGCIYVLAYALSEVERIL